MKRLITFLLALLLTWIGANAQTVIHECVADIDDWTATFTKSSTNTNDEHFVYNYWSTEDDGTGMTAPFLEYWAGSGFNLDDATIVHKTIAVTDAGYYNVSVFARLYNENSLTAPGAEEIYFHANDEKVDLATGTSTVYNNTSAVIYGTYTLLVYLEEEGDIEISFTVDSETSCDWLAFKNLSVEYLGATMPTLDYVTGTMNVDVEAAMKEAVDQYNKTFDSDDYLAALEAIEAAEESVAYYAPIVAAVNVLDEAGAAVWATSEYAEMLTECTLSDEDVSADLAAAQKAQTTAGTDWSYVLTSTGTWNSTGHPAFDPSTTFEVYGEVSSEGRVIYKTVSDLPAGTYTVSFYGAASLNNETSGVTSIENGASVYANEASQTIDINNLTGSDYGVTGWPEDELYTFECTVKDGTLEFGVSAGSQDNKGKWYIAKAVSLTLDELGVELEPGDEVHSCVAELSHWTQTFTNSGSTTGTFEQNTWSTEADASGMVTPFLQTWVASGNTISDQSIDHDQLAGMTPGWYSVTVDARIFCESGEAITGTATLTANDDFIYIIEDGSDGSYNGETEEYGTYAVQCYVDETGTLDIGFTIADANFNWFSWKNLSVVYLGETVEYNVGEATASTTDVRPGQTVTLKFADCTKGDDDATLGVNSSANVMFGSTAVTLTAKGTITFTFDVPEDVEEGEYTLSIPANTIEWTQNGETKAGNAQQTITFTVTVPYVLPDELTSGMFLKNLYNNDLMSRGKDYGTRADVDFIGIPLELVMNDEGKYLIRFADADLSSASYNYLYGPNWAWTDGTESTATAFTIEEVLDEETQELLGYHFINDLGYLYRYDAAAINANDTDNNYALALNGEKGNNYNDDSQVIWTFVDKDERDAIKAAWVASQKVALAAEAGLTDITTAEEFDAYVATLAETAIVENEISSTSAGDWTGSDNFTTNGVESYQTATRLTRSFTDLEPGIYKITLNGLDRNSDNAYSYQMYNDGYTDLSESYIYANDYEINLQAWGTAATYDETRTDPYQPTSMAQASDLFEAGSYPNELYTYVGEDGALSIQIALLVTEYNGWAIVKNFSLYRLDETETIDWEMTSAGWGTMIFPFDAEIPSGLTAYAGSALSLDEDESTITVGDASTSIVANVPYLVSGSTGTYTFAGVPTNTENSYTVGMLTGTLVDMTQDDFADSGQYVLQNHVDENGNEEDDGLAFYPITSESTGVTLSAYHCYLTLDNSTSPDGVRAFISLPGSDNEETGIVAVESETLANDAIYDLSGRRVSKAVKGVYIQNGKKVLVK